MENNPKQLFRQKSLDKIDASENTSSLIRVVNPGIISLLAAILIAIVGLLIWTVFGTIDSKVEIIFNSDGGKAELYVSEDRVNNVLRNSDVHIEDNTGKVMRVSSTAKRAGDIMDEYVMHLNGYDSETWIFQVRTNLTVESGIHKAEIIHETISPIQMIIGK